MTPTNVRFSPVLAIVGLCLAFSSLIRAESTSPDVDALNSILSGLHADKVGELLKAMSPEMIASLQREASKAMGIDNQASILQAAKDNGLLDSWKSKLDSLIDDGPEGPVAKDPKAPLPSARQQIDRNDVDYLLQVADEDLDSSNEVPKVQAPPVKKPAAMPKPSAAAYDKPKNRGETNKMPTKEKQPMDALVGMAKKLLGQADNDPTLDIVANMASSYLESSGGKSNGPDLSSMIQMASLFAGSNSNSGGSNPLESLVSMFGNSGMDLSQLLEVGSALMGHDTGAQRSAGRNKNKQMPSPMAELFIRFLANTFNLEHGPLISYYYGLTNLLEADSWDQINTVLRQTTGTDADVLLDALANNEIRQKMSDTSTEMLVDWLQEFLNPETFKTRIFYLNGMLMQYNLPAIDHKNLIETFSALVEQASGKLSGSKIELKPHLRQAESQLKVLLKIPPSTAIDFRNFTREQLTHAVENSIKTEVFDPLADFWADFRLASRHPKCARTIVCKRNSPAFFRTSLGLKEGITRATSTVVVWALSKTNNRGMPSFDALYAASMDGAHGVNCEARFQENCDQVLKQGSGRLSYQHQEL